MSTPISIDTLLSEGTCYTCFAPQPVPEIAILALWARIAGGGGTPCVPPDATVATAASGQTATEFVANWSAVFGTVNYFIDVSTDPLFGSFFGVYHNYAVAAPDLMVTITGTDANTTYYYRVRTSAKLADDLSCLSEYSNVITVLPLPQVTLLGTASATLGVTASISTPSISPASNALLLAFCYNTTELAAVTGNGLTWVRCADRENGFGRRVTVFRAMGAAPTPGAVTANFTNPATSGLYLAVVQVTSVDTTGSNGSGAINQWVWSDVNNVTCAPFNVDGLSVAIGSGVETVNPCTASAEAGWTQDVNAAQTGDGGASMGMFIAHRVGTTDATFNSSMAGSSISVAFEIKTAAQSNNVVDPATIANLGVWLKSDAGAFQDAAKAVPCTNGTTVYTWANQGSIAADAVQPTLAQRPVYNTGGGVNSLPRLTWAGAEAMLLASGSIAQPITIFAVLKYVSPTGGFGPVVWDNPVFFQLAFEVATGTRPYMYAGVTAPAIPASDMGGLPGNISCIYQNGTDEFYVNYAPARQMLLFSTGGSGINTSIHIGGYNNGTQHMNGDYYELLVFSRRLTQIERVQVQNYINRKYNF